MWLPESHSIYRILLTGSGSLSILKEGAPLWALPDLDGRIAGAIAQQVSGVILVDLYEAYLQNNRGTKYACEANRHYGKQQHSVHAGTSPDLSCSYPEASALHNCQHSFTLMAGCSRIWSQEMNMHKVVHTFRETS